ncbi:MAG: transcriptional repressor [Dehalococcoidales bacterium]|nr:transcriptional repressor [Dehalococcoidales bacterium]
MIIIRNTKNKIGNRPVTTQRHLLLELISQAKGHLDADELYRRAKEKEPRISLATVYRNIKLFKELGLIAESNLGEAHSHFEIRRTAEHHHLVCLGCGRVIEFKSPLIARAVAKMRQEHGFDITSAEMKLEGYCPQCKKEKRK